MANAGKGPVTPCHPRAALPRTAGGLTMASTKLFPALLIILDVLAAGAYAAHGFPDFPEWRKVIYWLAAACLTTVVTF